MSNSIIDRLKVSHQSIVDSIDQILPLTRSYVAAKPKIRDMSEKLVHHFGKQDQEFFETLRSCYEGNREAMKMIEFLTVDLKDIKVQYLIFFEKYTGELVDIGSRDFPQKFTEFSRHVLSRIRVEEEQLFPLIEKCPSFSAE